MTDKDFEIEIQDQQLETGSGVQLPLNFLTFGEIEPDDVKVYIKQSTYKALEKLANSDTTKELGSILIGDYANEMGKTHVVISDYVEAKYTDASASTLTFTHETWDYVHREHESRFPDKKIVGWQHTHPNYGIFLSNYDMFIQENFFNMPFQVAYVIDPIQNIRGFFQWKNGKIEKLKGYYIYDEVGKPIKIEQTKVKKAESAKPAGSSRLLTVLVALLCVITLLLSFFVYSLNRRYQAQLSIQESILLQLEEQKAVAAGQADLIAQLQGQLGDSQASIAQLTEMIEANKTTIADQEEMIQELQDRFVTRDGENSDYFEYTVLPGDTLYQICVKNGIDYHANEMLIRRINNITDPNMIYVGQIILLPLYD